MWMSKFFKENLKCGHANLIVAKRMCLRIDWPVVIFVLCTVNLGKLFILFVSQLLLCEIDLIAASHPKSKFPTTCTVL